MFNIRHQHQRKLIDHYNDIYKRMKILGNILKVNIIPIEDIVIYCIVYRNMCFSLCIEYT